MWERFKGEMEEFVKRKLKGGSHGFDHVLRVVSLSYYIGIREGTDLDILIPAAYLHDIARPDEEEKGVDHAVEGAKVAEEFLKRIGYPKDLIPQITHAIRVHRFRSCEEPKTLEAKVLKDADMLDALGAIGVIRAVLHDSSREFEEILKHLREKILKLPDLMYTETAKRLARERVKIVGEFAVALESDLRFFKEHLRKLLENPQRGDQE